MEFQHCVRRSARQRGLAPPRHVSGDHYTFTPTEGSRTDDQIECVVAKALESMPAKAHTGVLASWPKRRLSQNAIARIWHAFGLQSHRENCKFSKHRQFFEKGLRRIVFESPYQAIILCVGREELGAGVESHTANLAPLSARGCRRANRTANKGVAPFIVCTLDVATGRPKQG